jgi:hypothetical protein
MARQNDEEVQETLTNGFDSTCCVDVQEVPLNEAAEPLAPTAMQNAPAQLIASAPATEVAKFVPQPPFHNTAVPLA